jgi:hypothetical protein
VLGDVAVLARILALSAGCLVNQQPRGLQFVHVGKFPLDRLPVSKRSAVDAAA